MHQLPVRRGVRQNGGMCRNVNETAQGKNKLQERRLNVTGKRERK